MSVVKKGALSSRRRIDRNFCAQPSPHPIHIPCALTQHPSRLASLVARLASLVARRRLLKIQEEGGNDSSLSSKKLDPKYKEKVIRPTLRETNCHETYPTNSSQLNAFKSRHATFKRWKSVDDAFKKGEIEEISDEFS